MNRTAVCVAALLSFGIPVAAQERLPVGTPVGLPSHRSEDGRAPAEEPSGYDSGGRRDPFVSLLVTKKAAPAPAAVRVKAGLASLAMADLTVKGIVQNGAVAMAVLEGPDGKSFVVHRQDRLRDAVVKAIEADAVVFVAEAADAAGVVHARDVCKALRPAAEDHR